MGAFMPQPETTKETKTKKKKKANFHSPIMSNLLEKN
jgi:hypothetical protein